jgi:transcriptional regulator with XRE-family HTH domain
LMFLERIQTIESWGVEMTEGPRVVQARLAELGWKQGDLVREAGVNKNTISGYLLGHQKPRAATLARIEHALGLTHGTLTASGDDERPAPPVDLDTLFLEWVDASVAARKLEVEWKRARDLPDAETAHNELTERWLRIVSGPGRLLEGGDPPDLVSGG